jgi:hypothetical protein
VRFDSLEPPRSSDFEPPESPEPLELPEPPELLESLEPADEEDEPPSPDVELPDSDAAAALVRVVLELDRSFLAQPDPLKCTAGGTKALRSVPSAPHTGQNFGPGASIPWMNSVRVEQFEQM